MMQCSFIISALFSFWILTCCSSKYSPDWKSLDSRPLPSWYDDAKIGIFIHWGVFSVPSFGDHVHAGEWFWWYWQGVNMTDYQTFMNRTHRPDFTYADFAKEFRTEMFDPNQWADLFQKSGAKYVVLTSKHHEGYCNWATKYSFNWNSMDVGPKLDLVQMLATAIRKNTKLVFGLYHSLFEWFNPLFLTDQKNKFQTQYFVNGKTMPELYELVNQYKPDVIWSDGDWGATDAYWNSTTFLAWLYNDSPVKNTVVTNDRWGSGTGCKHGGFYTCEDRYNPGKLVNHKWENCFTLDKYSWGFRREMVSVDVMTIEDILNQVISTVSCGGNCLINVGPTQYGTIPAIFQERLLQLGNWLSINGEAIYSSNPWKFQNDTVAPKTWYTFKKGPPVTVYAMTLQFPNDGLLKLGCLKMSNSGGSVVLLGWGNVTFTAQGNSTLIQLPFAALAKLKWAWTLKIMGAIF